MVQPVLLAIIKTIKIRNLTVLVKMPSDPLKLVELKKRAVLNVRDKKISDLVPRMDKMLTTGLSYKEKKDYDKAYIMLTRYVGAYEFIRNHKDYKSAPEKYKLPSLHSINDAVTSLEYITDHLTNEYTLNSSSNNEKSINGNSIDNEILNLPETPTDEPINDKPDGFICCNDFYKMTKDPGLKYLIIDVRPSDDYDKSKIISSKVINIAENYIKDEKNRTSGKFERILGAGNRDHYHLFLKRSKKWVNKIVLLDWSTSKDNITQDKTVSIMKTILEKWDQEKPENIFILDGGYSALLLTFPMILTNANVSAPNNEINNSYDEILDGVSYPDWMKDIDKSKIPPNNNIIKTDLPYSYDNHSDDELNNYKNILKLDNDNNDNTIGVHKLSQEISTIVIKNQDKIMPIIPDRSVKPVTTFDREHAINLTKTMEELIEFSKKHLKLERQIYDLELKLHRCLTTDKRFLQDDDDIDLLRPQIFAVKATIDSITETLRKIPIIDRSTKPPPILNQQNEINNIRRSPWKDRTINMDPVYRNGNPGITGLKNLGNSCYMNSIIQCLSNTTYLTKYLNNGGYQDDLNTGNDNETQGRIAEEFAQVIRALWRGQYRSIAPRDLKDTIGQFRQQFHSHEQQDSHEFLTFFLEWMHNDLKKDEKIKMDGTITPAKKAWDKELKGQYSIISKLFIGQFRSTIQCQMCHKKSITYETFSSLSISLPDTNRCTLDDCIERFLRAQEIQGWTCPNCKTNRDATKKFDFVKLPPILIVHLNRFAGTTMKLEKKNTHVTFPVDNFNLDNHLVNEDDNDFNRAHSYSYNLYGLSNHYGSMDGGHYTAYCKNSQLDKWYKFDDQTVTEIQKNEVKTQNTSAYLLFYTSYPSQHTAPYIDR
ncbi:hypothetical protein HCN44_005376 [Aphidius gifuensis]|uniref:Ubiquitin carboxyl-terminal hydrolase n=1 Tax=Aphidius gifuensis TaxID=684658 RepID=A0A835CVC8_APHGI|nr:hypothetical protein HCN44_005376 [Aphidius gifuensis]